MRHPFVRIPRFGIQDFKAADDVGIRIRQQRKLDLVALRKVPKDGLTIVANRGQLDAPVLELCFGILQLHQLRFAKGSPIRGTEEKDGRPLGTFQRFIGLFVAELIRQRKRGRPLPDFQAD